MRRTRILHHYKPKQYAFTDIMKKHIVSWMKTERWTPELISARAKDLDIEMVSHETIYRWIWDMKISNPREDKPYKYLDRYLKPRRRCQKRGRIRDSCGIIHEQVSIEKRPAIVNKRKRIGDIEVGLMREKIHESALIVLTDRAILRPRRVV